MKQYNLFKRLASALLICLLLAGFCPAALAGESKAFYRDWSNAYTSWTTARKTLELDKNFLLEFDMWYMSYDVQNYEMEGEPILWLVNNKTGAKTVLVKYTDYWGFYLEEDAKGKEVSKSLTVSAGTYTLCMSNFVAWEVTLVGTPLKKSALQKKSLTLAKGDSAKIKVTNTKGKTLKWSSSNEKVATVSKKGVVKAVGAGSATITCKTSMGETLKATVKVAALKKSSANLVMRLNNAKTLEVLNAKGQKITFSSSNKKVATVTKKGVVKAVGYGEAKIYVKINGGKALVAKVCVPKITVPQTTYHIGDTVKIGVKYTGSNKVTWKVGNRNVLGIDGSHIWGAGKGSAYVYITIGGVTFRKTVTIKK